MCIPCRCDLSLSAGAEVSQTSNPIEVLSSLDNDILVNNSEFVWNLLRKKVSSNTDIIDMVLDNAGYELFTDLCLAVFLIACKLAGKVRFYVKRYPWYVSDTTIHDFHWTLEYMKNSSSGNLQELAKLSYDYLQNNTWTIEVYFTLYYMYCFLKDKLM